MNGKRKAAYGDLLSFIAALITVDVQPVSVSALAFNLTTGWMADASG
ncbi:TPA: hypothetical protein JC757_004403 [Salmonella enterica subsp. diarizonae]|nr:hypothetical protein [Salmonella enterica subsp. diarizonae]